MNDKDRVIGPVLPIVLTGMLGLVLVAGLLFALQAAKRRSLDRVDGVGLTETVQRWLEAGMPQGNDLEEFMRGRGDTVVSNRQFILEGTTYMTLFAVTNLRSHRNKTLFVTTNKTLIFLDGYGKAELFLP